MKKGQFFQWNWNWKVNRLNKYIKKENFQKDPINLIQTNQQINMTSSNFISNNDFFKSI